MRKKYRTAALLMTFVLTMTQMQVFADEVDPVEDDDFYSEDFISEYTQYGHYSASDAVLNSKGDQNIETVEELPASWNSKEYMTEIKDQGWSFLAWDFAAVAAMETNINKKYGEDAELSEKLMAYGRYSQDYDPKEHLFGEDRANEIYADVFADGDVIDGSEYGYLNIAGNNYTASGIAAAWMGPCCGNDFYYLDSEQERSEAITEMYSGLEKTPNISDDGADEYHVNKIEYLENPGSNKTMLKSLLMEYGGGTIAFYMRKNTACIYEAEDIASNVEMEIIGWDDDFPKESFTYNEDGEDITPQNNGAWMLKGSFGTDNGDNGIYYLSYEDASIGEEGDSIAVFYDMLKSGDSKFYDHNYQYDFSDKLVTSDELQGAENTFTILDTKTGYEELKAVGVLIMDEDTEVRISLYLNSNDYEPTSGELITEKSFRSSLAGYYTVPLDGVYVAEEFDTVTVVVEYYGGVVPFRRSYKEDEAGAGYIYCDTEDGTDIYDLGCFDVNNSVAAYESMVLKDGQWMAYCDAVSDASENPAFTVKLFTNNTELKGTGVVLDDDNSILIYDEIVPNKKGKATLSGNFSFVYCGEKPTPGKEASVYYRDYYYFDKEDYKLSYKKTRHAGEAVVIVKFKKETPAYRMGIKKLEITFAIEPKLMTEKNTDIELNFAETKVTSIYDDDECVKIGRRNYSVDKEKKEIVFKKDYLGTVSFNSSK
ncbi:MAG: hypothetical protein K6F39_04530 [Lachnospiraceae bacterium]|nr:hypothetical protein [Lachnospiraceae bacterium]